MNQTAVPIPIPDLDNDILTYRFTISKSGISNEYFIERSINGGKFHTIGTVSGRSGDWSRSGNWIAKPRGGAENAKGGHGDTRKAAVRSLEYNMQGPEYAERKRAEYQAEQARQAQEAQEALNDRQARVARLAGDLPLLGVFGGYITRERLLEDVRNFYGRTYTPEQVIELLEFTVRWCPT